MKQNLLYASLLSLPLAACGSDPVNYSAPVGIELKAKSGDVAQASLTSSKDITTESGNPYGAFVNTAEAKLSGKTPSAIEVSDLTLTLGGQSTGVNALEQVMTGDVDVAFVVNNTNNTYDAGHVINPTGVGPVAMDPNFDWSTVAEADRTQMLNGSFKVVLRAPAAASFASSGASVSLQVTFTFDALQ